MTPRMLRALADIEPRQTGVPVLDRPVTFWRLRRMGYARLITNMFGDRLTVITDAGRTALREARKATP